jgi:hypothetical protein
MQEPFSTARAPAPIKTKLADGTIIYIQARTLGGDQQVAGGRLPPFDEVTQAIKGIATPLVQMLKEIQPRKATLAFSVEVAVEAGHLTALLVKGSADATMTITLEWGE